MEIVTFGLANSIQGIHISQVEEIIMDQDPLEVPNVPDFLKGIIKLRNQIIPVVEGTERLGFPAEQIPPDGNGNILIVNYEDELLGIRVESVDKVIKLDNEKIHSSPDSIDGIGGEHVDAVAEVPVSVDSKQTSGYDPSDSTGQKNNTNGEHHQNKSEKTETPTKNILLLNPDAMFSKEESSKIKNIRTEQDPAHPNNPEEN